MIRKITILLTILFSLSVHPVYSKEEYNEIPNLNTTGVKIAIGSFKLNNEKLEIRYQIQNNSNKNIWICEDIDINNSRDFEVFLLEDVQTLMIRRRLDVPSIFRESPTIGSYVRLHPSQTRSESLSVNIPVYPCAVFSVAGMKERDNFQNLILEIGYYNEDFPQKINSIINEVEKVEYESGPIPIIKIDDLGIRIDYFTAELFKTHNDNINNAIDHIKIPYTYDVIKGGQSVKLKIEGLDIPFIGFQEFWIEDPKKITKPTTLSMLKDLFYDGKIEAENLRYAETLLYCDKHLYNNTAKKIADVYEQVAEGQISPNQLDRLLDSIAGKKERDEVLKEIVAKKEEENHKKQVRIENLLSQAKSYNKNSNDKQAILVLDELLKLDPYHEEVRC